MVGEAEQNTKEHFAREQNQTSLLIGFYPLGRCVCIEIMSKVALIQTILESKTKVSPHLIVRETKEKK